MTPLRKRYIEDLELAGYSPSTIKAYVHAVEDLSKHHMRSPDTLSEIEIRDFFLHLTNKRKLSESTIRQKCFGIKWFFELTLKRKIALLNHIQIRRQKLLPVVLNFTEVRDILSCIRIPLNKACLTLIYSCGLRAQEGVSLRRGDIDTERKMLRVSQGKGKKDRCVPVPTRVLELLQPYITNPNRETDWLFPSRFPPRHLTKGGIRHTYKAALKEAKITKKACIHTLRHSYATHLMEHGVSIRTIQSLLGHKSIETTMIYTHLTEPSSINVRDVIEELAARL